MIAKLHQENAEYPDLTTGTPYVVIGIEADDFRLLNDHGCPYLYPSHLFAVVDSYEPSDWVAEYGEEGERYAYPPDLNGAGFFEDFFDGKDEAVVTFWRTVNQRLALTAGAV